MNSYVKISDLTKVADQKDVQNLFETAIDLVVVKGFLEKMAAQFDHHLELIPKKKEQEDVIRKKKHGELKLVFHKKSVYQNEKCLTALVHLYKDFKLTELFKAGEAHSKSMRTAYFDLRQRVKDSIKFAQTSHCVNIIVNKLNSAPHNILARMFNQFVPQHLLLMMAPMIPSYHSLPDFGRSCGIPMARSCVWPGLRL